MMNDEGPDEVMEAEEPEAYSGRPNWAVGIGRLLGLLVIAGGMALGAKVATDVREDEIWAFIQFSITPAALGSLILIGSEALDRLGRVSSLDRD